ncbi:MAG: branched-chain amino acid transaminase [bacterium]|jgi:branched-chain amino acid aminotransferase
MRAEKVWFDGRMVDWEDAKVHVMVHALHYGTGIFEGIRAYETKEGPAVFRLPEHLERLYNSAKIFRMEIPYRLEEMAEAVKATVRDNMLARCYIRPLVFRGISSMSINPSQAPVHCVVAAIPMGAYLGEGLKKGIRVKISSYARNYINSTAAKGKITGNYVNSALAVLEASEDGYDEAILLDPSGYVAEGSGKNIFWVRRGKLWTTPTPTVLEGITRATVMEIAADMGIATGEAMVTRDELYIADEVFFCGTGAEITPVREIDRRTIGAGGVGPVTQRIQAKYFGIVQGEEAVYRRWLTVVGKE